jgi:hypothetical protein
VNKTETCWLWIGRVDDDGYGVYDVNSRKQMKAHRYIYNITNGEIPDKMLVRHTCDVRNCVNLSHLLIGTQQDNMNDMVERGRQSKLKGESNPRAKLTADDVREIRIIAVFGFTYKELCKMYNVSNTVIGYIINRKSWKHV